MYSETNTSITLHSFFLYSKSPAKQQPQPEISLSEHNRISTCCNQQNTNSKRCCLKQSCHYRPDGKGQRTHIERLKYIFSCRIRQKDQKKGERSSSKQQQEHSNLEVFIVCNGYIVVSLGKVKNTIYTQKVSHVNRPTCLQVSLIQFLETPPLLKDNFTGSSANLAIYTKTYDTVWL